MSIKPLEKGDKVVMHTCLEAEMYDGQVWTCEGDEYEMCGQQMVRLEGFSGAFNTEFLQKVNVESVDEKILDWKKAKQHLDDMKISYSLVPMGHFALRSKIMPLLERYEAGERTPELYEEIMETE